MVPLRNSITFVVADLRMLVDERPAMIMPALPELLKLAGSGKIKVSLLHTAFSMVEMESALPIMQTARRTGKLVVVPRPDEVAKAIPWRDSRKLLRPGASYVLVEGSGILGQAEAL